MLNKPLHAAQLEHVNKNLDDLHRCKAELDMSIADKNETLEMERQCYAMGTLPGVDLNHILVGVATLNVDYELSIVN